MPNVAALGPVGAESSTGFLCTPPNVDEIYNKSYHTNHEPAVILTLKPDSMSQELNPVLEIRWETPHTRNCFLFSCLPYLYSFRLILVDGHLLVDRTGSVT
jgi:hypothetical protein